MFKFNNPVQENRALLQYSIEGGLIVCIAIDVNVMFTVWDIRDKTVSVGVPGLVNVAHCRG